MQEEDCERGVGCEALWHEGVSDGEGCEDAWGAADLDVDLDLCFVCFAGWMLRLDLLNMERPGRRRTDSSCGKEPRSKRVTILARLTLSPHTLRKSPGMPSWVFSPCETQPQVQLCRVSFPGARAFRTRGRVAAGRARQAERRLVMADIRSAVLDDTRSCGGRNVCQ